MQQISGSSQTLNHVSPAAAAVNPFTITPAVAAAAPAAFAPVAAYTPVGLFTPPCQI